VSEIRFEHVNCGSQCVAFMLV